MKAGPRSMEEKGEGGLEESRGLEEKKQISV